MLRPDQYVASGITTRRCRGPVVMLVLAVLAVLAGLAVATGFVPGVAPGGVAGASTSTGSTYSPPACHRPTPAPVQATPVAGVPSDWTITSFDGTKIRAHWFPAPGASASHPEPTVLERDGAKVVRPRARPPFSAVCPSRDSTTTGTTS